MAPKSKPTRSTNAADGTKGDVTPPISMPTHTNAQVTDAAKQITADVEAGSVAFASCSAQQFITQCFGLAMENVIAHQQRMDVVYSAMVSAAAREALDNGNAESLDVLEELLATKDSGGNLSQLLDTLSETLAKSLRFFDPAAGLEVA